MKLNKTFGLVLFSSVLHLSLSTAVASSSHPVSGVGCKNIEAACEAAGFKKRGHKASDGLWGGCMKPLLDGKSVTGVTVNSSDLDGCRTARSSKGLK